jgi:hypothetical protein
MKSKRKVDDDERKVTASKLASYKKRYNDAVSEQNLQAKRAAELSGRLEELRKEFDKTKDEHKNFQSQLFEHKTNVRAPLTFHHQLILSFYRRPSISNKSGSSSRS